MRREEEEKEEVGEEEGEEEKEEVEEEEGEEEKKEVEEEEGEEGGPLHSQSGYTTQSPPSDVAMATTGRTVTSVGDEVIVTPVQSEDVQVVEEVQIVEVLKTLS